MAPFLYNRRVEFRDTDSAGIAHFSTFFNFMEEAEHAFLRSRGLSVVMQDAEGTISWPRVSAKCDYRSAVQFEDVMTIEVVIARLGEKSATFVFTFQSGERLIAEGEITAVCCRIEAGKPPRGIPIPQEMRSKLEADGE